ncbi:DNA binding domain-containing protein, excisionase family [Amycolatopsis arida]|uniref:DNA binding domain-containing protein, excisionase family n=1 Tax=Amycolatopsis arida TaxID=587909 RepID=A0A1I6ALR7_9PSEU|nr:helix-turn-helix domain-containing protein [Amycolatopsis arida]TDX87381.1 excisionase family DNA binding protein [Amycolatopsis arida]SFQ69580.1 DNA binding domain-containing protein, excisionase family [Amycolatopsis arida]
MSTPLYSTEEVAERLGLHVRTVRGYVRDGRLRAVRIGKQYRIMRADLEAFVGAPVTDPPDVRRHRHVDVSSVVEIDAVAPETAHRVSTLLTAVRSHPGDQPLRVETVYDEERARMKIIIIGGLADTRQLLEYAQAVLES